jgi:hypothetical protein
VRSSCGEQRAHDERRAQPRARVHVARADSEPSRLWATQFHAGGFVETTYGLNGKLRVPLARGAKTVRANYASPARRPLRESPRRRGVRRLGCRLAKPCQPRVHACEPLFARRPRPGSRSCRAASASKRGANGRLRASPRASARLRYRSPTRRAP